MIVDLVKEISNRKSCARVCMDMWYLGELEAYEYHNRRANNRDEYNRIICMLLIR